MNVNIQSRLVELTPGLETHIYRKLHFELSRMESHITALAIIVSDVNGPKGGIDKQCLLQVSVANKGYFVIKDRQTDIYYAIDRVMQRVSRLVARKIVRKHRRLNRPTKTQLADGLAETSLLTQEQHEN